MKTVNIYSLNELSDTQKKNAIGRVFGAQKEPTPSDRRKFFQKKIDEWVDGYFSVIPHNLVSTEFAGDIPGRVVPRLTNKKPEIRNQFIFTESGEVKIKLHIKSFGIRGDKNNLVFTRNVGVKQTKGSDGSKFVFDDGSPSSFMVNVNSKMFSLLDPIDICLLSDDVQTTITAVKDWFKKTEHQINEELTKYISTLDSDHHFAEIKADKEREIQNYFEGKWFSANGDLVPEYLLEEMDWT